MISISIEEAIVLSKSQDGIDLDITSGLTNDVAVHLIKAQGGIKLTSLTLLQEDVAATLSQYPEEVALGGVRLRASTQAIDNLSQHKGPSLSIWNIAEFTLEMAVALSKHTGSLSISTLKENGLNEEALVELAKHKGDLCIMGSFPLGTEAINAFVNHEGSLLLPSITNMSPEITKAFKKHKGPVSLPGKFSYTHS